MIVFKTIGAASSLITCSIPRLTRLTTVPCGLGGSFSPPTRLSAWRSSGANDGDDRLLEELMIEFSRQAKYMEALGDQASRLVGVEAVKEERRQKYGDGPLTTEEKEFLEANGGLSKAMRVADGFVEKWGLNDRERNECLLDMIAMIKFFRAQLPLIPAMPFAMDIFMHQLEQGPPVMPQKGFPDNDAVTKHYLQKRLETEQQNNIPEWQSVSFGNILESPFGPLSSSACYEELSSLWTVHLNTLRKKGIGAPHSGTKLYLTVVEDAFVSKTPAVSILVEDDSGQRVMLQIFNKKGVQPTVNGLEEFPVGARLYLKNPFLKLGRDGWIFLRVDQPFDLQRLDLPPLVGSVLIFGEGDFSYARSLASVNKVRGKAHITATSLDSPDYIKKTYSHGESNLDHLEGEEHVTVLHHINALEPSPKLVGTSYDSILWNFPYQKLRGPMDSEEGAKLVESFLQNAASVLSPTGYIYLTLAQRQGGTTREAAASKLAWDVEKQAAKTGYDVVEVLPFRYEDFIGYEPKRAYTDSTFPSENAKTHILRPKKKTEAGEAPSDRTIFSRLVSFATDMFMGRNPKTHYSMSPDKAIKMLEPHADESSTAGKLLWSAKAFRDIMDALSSLVRPAIDGDTVTTEDFFALGIDVTSTFYKIYCIPEAELVCEFPGDKLYLSRALIGSSIIQLLAPYINKVEEDAVVKAILDENSFDSAVIDACLMAKDRMGMDERIQLGKAMFVVASLEMYADMKNAQLLVNAAREVHPNEANIVSRCVSVKCNLLQEGSRSFEAEKQSIIEDCRMILDLVDKEVDHDLYRSALFSMGYAYRQSSYEQDHDEEIRLYNEYIRVAEKTDRHLPSVYYHVGMLSLFRGCVTNGAMADPLVAGQRYQQNLETAREYYQQGLSSENDRLPFFGPVVAGSKRLLSVATMMKRDQTWPGQVDTPKESVSGSKAEKGSPTKDEEEIWCTSEEVRDLLKDKGDLSVSAFATEYRKKYSRSPYKSTCKAKQVLHDLSQTGLFTMEERAKRGSLWLTIPKKEAKGNREKEPPSTNGAETSCTAEQVRGMLLNAEEGTLSLSIFVDKYKAQYGQHPFRNKRTKERLQELSKSGLFHVVHEANESAWFISLPKRNHSRTKNVQEISSSEDSIVTAEEVRNLLDDVGGRILVSSFPLQYQQKYGRMPRRGKRLRQTLEKLSRSGRFVVGCMPDGCTFFLARKMKPGGSCTADEVRSLVIGEGGTLLISQFVAKYQEKYGRMPFKKRGVKKYLQDLTGSGMFSIQCREDGTTFFLSSD